MDPQALIHATMCMNLENIMLPERNQTQKVTHFTISFLWNILDKPIEKEGRWVVARD